MNVLSENAKNVLGKTFLSDVFQYTSWKVSVFGVILVRIFPHSDWIQRDTLYHSYSVRMRENADQNNSEYGHFLRNRWTKALFLDLSFLWWLILGKTMGLINFFWRYWWSEKPESNWKREFRSVTWILWIESEKKHSFFSYELIFHLKLYLIWLYTTDYTKTPLEGSPNLLVFFIWSKTVSYLNQRCFLKPIQLKPNFFKKKKSSNLLK